MPRFGGGGTARPAAASGCYVVWAGAGLKTVGAHCLENRCPIRGWHSAGILFWVGIPRPLVCVSGRGLPLSRLRVW